MFRIYNYSVMPNLYCMVLKFKNLDVDSVVSLFKFKLSEYISIQYVRKVCRRFRTLNFSCLSISRGLSLDLFWIARSP